MLLTFLLALFLGVLSAGTMSSKNVAPKSEEIDVDVVSSCSKCNLFFMSQAEFVAHKKLRSCSRRFTCQSCGKMYTRIQPLVSHLIEAQHGERVCSVCNFAGETHGDMETHIQRHAIDLSKVEIRICDQNYVFL